MNKRRLVMLVCACLLALASCGRESKGEKKLASVNGAPIYESDFRRELELRARRDSSAPLALGEMEARLNTIIDKKLLIGEAVKAGMSEDKRFVETIKVFWEQTLLRTLIDAKTKEWALKLSVTEAEINAYYGKMPFRLMLLTASGATKEKANAALLRMPPSATTGPVLVEDVNIYSPFYAAFDLNAGETGYYQDGPAYVAVKILKKEELQTPQLSAVREKISASLFEQKKEHALAQWITALRQSAKITVDSEMLKQAALRK